MARSETKTYVRERPYESKVVYDTATDFIFGFKQILGKIPAVAKVTSNGFWDAEGKTAMPLDDKGTVLEVYWRPSGTILDLTLNNGKDFKMAFLTAADSDHASFFYADEDTPLPLEDGPSAEGKIKQLREELRSFIPSEE